MAAIDVGKDQKSVRMILLGKTNAGKSRTANTILGLNENRFPFGVLTSECAWKQKTRFGRTIEVVDTPGVFSAGKNNEETQEEIKRCIFLSSPGPHALVLCVKMGRFTEEDVDTFRHFVKYFGKEILQYAVVVFTHYDVWLTDMNDKGIEQPDLAEFIKSLPDYPQQFLKDCSNRYVFFNNRKEGEEQENQVMELLNSIDTLIKYNGDKFYTNETYEKVEKAFKEQLEKEDGKNREDLKNSPTFFSVVSQFLGIVEFFQNLFKH